MGTSATRCRYYATKTREKSSSSSGNCSWKIAKWVKLFNSIKQPIHRLKNIFKSYKYPFYYCCSGNFFITQEMHFKIIYCSSTKINAKIFYNDSPTTFTLVLTNLLYIV